MAASSIAMKLTLVALLCVAVALPIAQAVTCGQVASSLGHCVNYLKSGGNVPSDCCSGISNLNAMAKTTPDRQTACNCIKQLAGSMKPNPSIAAGLPGKCGINIPYPISASINCATIK